MTTTYGGGGVPVTNQVYFAFCAQETWWQQEFSLFYRSTRFDKNLSGVAAQQQESVMGVAQSTNGTSLNPICSMLDDGFFSDFVTVERQQRRSRFGT